MTDQEINEAVARKLGASYCDCKFLPHAIEHKNYCTSIAAAWEIWDHFNEMATLTKLNGLWVLDYGRKFVVNADTAPMAICLAFLKLEDKKET